MKHETKKERKAIKKSAIEAHKSFKRSYGSTSPTKAAKIDKMVSKTNLRKSK